MGPYAGGLRLLVHELKFRGRRRVATHVAETIVANAASTGFLSEGSVLVPVPLHPRRRRERGFNQSEVLADAIGRRSGLPVAAAALVRRKETISQTGLSAAARRANVADAFAVRRRTRVAGRVVVLVDDVVTTGATARACARALRQAGAREVRLLTLARVD
jgi:ComF family protein